MSFTSIPAPIKRYEGTTQVQVPFIPSIFHFENQLNDYEVKRNTRRVEITRQYTGATAQGTNPVPGIFPFDYISHYNAINFKPVDNIKQFIGAVIATPQTYIFPVFTFETAGFKNANDYKFIASQVQVQGATNQQSFPIPGIFHFETANFGLLNQANYRYIEPTKSQNLITF